MIFMENSGNQKSVPTDGVSIWLGTRNEKWDSEFVSYYGGSVLSMQRRMRWPARLAFQHPSQWEKSWVMCEWKHIWIFEMTCFTIIYQ